MKYAEVTPIWQANWQPQLPAPVDPQLADWLYEAGSLTARLQKTGRSFRLQLVMQQPVTLPDFLQQRWQTESGLQREVILYLDDQPCVYAQSFLPDHTVAALQPLATLGEVPLGHYIFTRPGLYRSEIEVCELTAGLDLPGLGPQRALAGRRSYFQLEQHEMLVQELFLPALGDFTLR